MTDPHDPVAFYTGLVAELYAPLRGSTPDPAIYERSSMHLAGATFNLLPCDPDAVAALTHMREHLTADGRALVPPVTDASTGIALTLTRQPSAPSAPAAC